MTESLLVGIVIWQSAALLTMTVGLAIAHQIGVRRDRRLVRELDGARDVVRRFLSRHLLAEEASSALGKLSGKTLSALLHEFTAGRSGEDCERTYELLRTTRWYARLARLAGSRFWWKRLRAARAIATLAQPEHLLVVHRLLEDDSPAVRLAAAAALERLPSPGLAGAILERALAAHGAERNHLIQILAESDTLVLPEMVRRLSGDHDKETLRVLLSLTGRLGYTSLLPYVSRHASDEDLDIRISTATCLRNFPHPETANALRRLLTDPAWEVRARAAASLGAIGALEAIPDLVMSLQDTTWWVRLRSAIALRLVGPPGIEALKRIDPNVDQFAWDMATYVLELDDGAMAEYIGGATIDFSSASTRALAS